MKVEEQNVATFNVGIKETAVAQIQASAKAFEILSSGLYSDAEFAIVREIAANAWDSHKSAGCADKPFRVQIPTGLDPRFCIRDYGTSMSHEFMMTRVNTYFDSTKNDNNDEIGGFGLGIKSVFSYTTSFMIACFLDGIRRVYVYQIGEKGLPEISLMAETETDEPNGVEVSIPVKEEDYRKFRIAVQKTFAFYDVKPEVIGVELAIPEFKKQIEGTNWFICNKEEVFERDVYIEMGGIAYPVESNMHGMSFYGRAQTLFLKASIGDIDITPNREQVKLTDRTRKFTASVMETAKQEIFDIVQTTVNEQNFTNYWDMIDFLVPFRNDMTNKMGLELKKIKFNGHEFDSDYFVAKTVPAPTRKDPNDPESELVPVTIQDFHVPGMINYNTWEMSYNDRVSRGGRSWHEKTTMNFDRFHRPYTIVVLEDRQGGHVTRWMKAQGTRKIYAVTAASGKAAEVVAKLKTILQDFPSVYNAADLTYDKALFTQVGGDRKTYMYHSGRYEAVVRTEVSYSSLPSTVYYVVTDGRQKGMMLGREVDFKNQGDFIDVVRNWLGAEVYYLTEAMVSKIQKHRPDVTLELFEPKLEAMVIEKVKAASANYFANDMASLEAPFTRSNTKWRVEYAMQHWARIFNLNDLTVAKEVLKGHKPDTDLEKMCRLVMKKSIFELFAEHEIEVPSVSLPNFDKLIEKMPYVYALVDDYQDAPVVDHIAATMGWEKNLPVEA